MKKQALIVIAATLAVFAADLSFARGGGGGGGGGMGSGGMGGGSRSGSQGQYGAQAPDSAKQTRTQTRDATQAQAPIRDQSRDRVHQPVASDSILQQ